VSARLGIYQVRYLYTSHTSSCLTCRAGNTLQYSRAHTIRYNKPVRGSGTGSFAPLVPHNAIVDAIVPVLQDCKTRRACCSAAMEYAIKFASLPMESVAGAVLPCPRGAASPTLGLDCALEAIPKPLRFLIRLARGRNDVNIAQNGLCCGAQWPVLL
jgi:hypothetical protein